MSDEEKKVSSDGGEREATEAEQAKAKAKAEAAAAARAQKAAEEAAKPAWERDPAAPEVEDAADDPLARELREAHGPGFESAVTVGGDLVLHVDRRAIRDVCKRLVERHGYRLLVDLCGADYPDRENERFEIIYHVYSLEENRRVRIKVRVADGEEVPSVTGIWRGANWCEREVFDMFGVRFQDHPDLTRILMWDGFHGHPLRKDFPVEGVDTGAAIYPEYYDESDGPIGGTGTGWKSPVPEEPAPAEGESSDERAAEDGEAGSE